MRALVTGGTGFIGSHITSRLIREGWDVVVTGNDTEVRIPNFSGTMLYAGFQPLDWSQVGRIDALFHEAAINDTTYLNESEMLRHNTLWPAQLFREAVAHGAKYVVYASSTAIYGDAPAPYVEGVTPLRPLNPYGLSKLRLEEEAEKLSREFPEVRFVGLRYCNVFGPGEAHKGKRASMIRQLALQMQKGNPRLFAPGDQKRDFAYVEDIVTANLAALTARESVAVNCGGGSATTFNEVVAQLNEVLGLNRTPEYFENPIADRYQNHTECDMTKAREVLGFVPQYDVRAGIRDYFARGLLDT